MNIPVKSHFIVLFYFFLSFPFFAQKNAESTIFTNDSAFLYAHVGASFCEYNKKSIGFVLNSQKSHIPASLVKLITTATALELLSPDYRIKTSLESNGFVDEKGVLQGDLYIKGWGDPSLGSSFTKGENFIKTWISVLKEKGISSVNGRLIVDVSAYDKDPIPFLWLREDLGSYYGSGVFATSVFDNSYILSLKTEGIGSNSQIISEIPNVGYIYDNQFEIRSVKRDSAYIIGEPYSCNRLLSGVLRSNQEKLTIKGDISNPPLFLARYLVEKFSEEGLSVSGGYDVSFEKAQKTSVIYVHYSEPLSELIRITNFFSNNNYAEHLLKHLSLQQDSVANYATALKIVRRFWADKGLDVSGLFLYDGSGLSPKNAVSPDFICNLLVYMRTKSAYSDVFYHSLPLAGQQGTVASFLKKTSLNGKVRLKSGSFKNVQCYAGYITENNKEYAFCVMVNNFVGERKKTVALIEDFLIETISEIKK